MTDPTQGIEYSPPTGNEPLDARERALVRALVQIIARQIREEVANTQAATPIANSTSRRAG